MERFNVFNLCVMNILYDLFLEIYCLVGFVVSFLEISKFKEVYGYVVFGLFRCLNLGFVDFKVMFYFRRYIFGK